MAKIIKKKFHEIDIPILNEKLEAFIGGHDEINGKTIRFDLTRKLKGKSVDLILKIEATKEKAVAYPKKLILLPFFIKHMIHSGISYVEDSFSAETREDVVIVKPFLITRKKVSRAVRNALRNSTKNWIIDYLKEKTTEEIFSEALSNQLQKSLSIKLKKIYPLAICEIRILEVKKSLPKKV